MPMRSWRHRVGVATVDGRSFSLVQGHLLVVLREGDDEPQPTDWEVTLVTDPPRRLPPGRHELALDTVDGTAVSGAAVVRFSDGSQHLLRGDGRLDGVERLLRDDA